MVSMGSRPVLGHSTKPPSRRTILSSELLHNAPSVGAAPTAFAGHPPDLSHFGHLRQGGRTSAWPPFINRADYTPAEEYQDSPHYWQRVYAESNLNLSRAIDNLETKLRVMQERIEAVETRSAHETPVPQYTFSPATPVAMKTIAPPPPLPIQPQPPTPKQQEPLSVRTPLEFDSLKGQWEWRDGNRRAYNVEVKVSTVVPAVPLPPPGFLSPAAFPIIEMERIPNEILREIASMLPVSDLHQFRLVDRRCAAMGFPALGRRLYVLNTIACLQEFRKFLDTVPTIYTRHLTIYHGKWPVCSREEWETHPLILYENFPRPSVPYQPTPPTSLSVATAFQKYREFLSREEARCYRSDSDIVAQILGRFSRLDSVTIETLQPWGRVPGSNAKLATLREEIWILPTFNGAMNRMVRCVIDSLHRNPSIRSLDIRGKVRDTILLEWYLGVVLLPNAGDIPEATFGASRDV
ncbi:hypothetical protein NUW58_g2017 [Xylaria curta]|uniref:Uncharacterized protein n=1 Tax=Xylaria curta TaxID=42375 RepID=A0ACC1PIJ3_9PEZI|nr:hypothetical protein NUW58_g2017 [Xylaria curta]